MPGGVSRSVAAYATIESKDQLKVHTQTVIENDQDKNSLIHNEIDNRFQVIEEIDVRASQPFTNY